MGAVTVVVGGQYGSEGKGAVAAHLARRSKKRVDACIRVAGPNAGHTAVDDDGQPWALRQVPAVAVVDRRCQLVIAPGSEIDPDVLSDEIKRLDAAGFDVSSRLWIDRSATIIQPEDKVMEGAVNLVDRVGSTGKGIGAARARRLLRQADTVEDVGFGPGDHVIDTVTANRQALVQGGHLLIEGTQGYGLGLHTPFYPQCTSSDCRAIDFMAMAGISPWQPGAGMIEIWIATRTYPIRVAGNSGPMLEETDWETLGGATGGHVKTERTTVTQKIRRVGGWDPELVRAAVLANGGGFNGDRVGFQVRMALTFLDYWYPDVANLSTLPTGEEGDVIRARLRSIERDLGCLIGLVTTGPATGWFR